MPPTEIAALTFFALAFVCGMAWNVLYPQLLRRLRTHHREVWEQMGCPKYIELRLIPMVDALRFLLQRRYLVIKDESLVSLAAWSRAMLITTVAAMALWLLFIVPTIAAK